MKNLALAAIFAALPAVVQAEVSVERGAYLVRGPGGCGNCHTPMGPAGFDMGNELGGRLVEVAFYEWAYYSQHPWHIPFYWLGGMSTHGLLLGGAIGVFVFCGRRGLSFLSVADELSIAAAWIMGLGRLANSIVAE